MFVCLRERERMSNTSSGEMAYVEHIAGVNGLPKVILREVRGCSAEVPFVERTRSLFLSLIFIFFIFFSCIVFCAYFINFLVLEFWFSIDFVLSLRIYALLHVRISCQC